MSKTIIIYHKNTAHIQKIEQRGQVFSKYDKRLVLFYGDWVIGMLQCMYSVI